MMAKDWVDSAFCFSAEVPRELFHLLEEIGRKSHPVLAIILLTELCSFKKFWNAV